MAKKKKVINKKAAPTPEKPMSEGDKEWYRGYACAAGVVANISSADNAQEVLKQGGITRETLEKAKAEPYDIALIFDEEYDG